MRTALGFFAAFYSLIIARYLQFLFIWYSNIPEEVICFQHSNRGWKAVFLNIYAWTFLYLVLHIILLATKKTKLKEFIVYLLLPILSAYIFLYVFLRY